MGYIKVKEFKFLCLLYLLFFIINTSYAEKFKEYVLDNGLKVIIKEEHKYPAVLVQLWYKVGSSYERSSQSGLSYLLEQMSSIVSSDPHTEYLKKLFFEKGGEYNSRTSLDYTVYTQIAPPQELELALKLEFNRMNNLLFDDQVFSNEKETLIIKKSLDDQFNKNLFFRDQLYKAADPNFWIHDVEELRINDLRQWYTNWYTPNNAILIIAGDVKSTEAYNLAQQYFGNIAARHVNVGLNKSSLHPVLKYKRLEIKLPIKVQHLFMEYKVPSLNTAKEHWEPYAIEVLIHLLSDGNSCRFSKYLVRNADPVAFEVKATYNLFRKQDTSLLFSAIPVRHKLLMVVEEAIDQQIETLKSTLVSDLELKNVKNRILANSAYETDSLLEQMNKIGSLESAGYNFGLTEHRLKEIKGITAKQIQAVAKKYLVKNYLTVVYLMPED